MEAPIYVYLLAVLAFICMLRLAIQRMIQTEKRLKKMLQLDSIEDFTWAWFYLPYLTLPYLKVLYFTLHYFTLHISIIILFILQSLATDWTTLPGALSKTLTRNEEKSWCPASQTFRVLYVVLCVVLPSLGRVRLRQQK